VHWYNPLAQSYNFHHCLFFGKSFFPKKGCRTPDDQLSMVKIYNMIRDRAKLTVKSEAWHEPFRTLLETESKFKTIHPWRKEHRFKGTSCQVCARSRPSSVIVKLGTREFATGSFCYKRSKLYHELWHFTTHVKEALRYKVECIKEEAEQPLSDLEFEARTIGKEAHFMVWTND
jgi:hypothetical protein